jgi:hypothetical protein
LQDNAAEGGFSVTPSRKGGRPKLTPAERAKAKMRKREQARLRQQKKRAKRESQRTV